MFHIKLCFSRNVLIVFKRVFLQVTSVSFRSRFCVRFWVVYISNILSKSIFVYIYIWILIAISYEKNVWMYGFVVHIHCTHKVTKHKQSRERERALCCCVCVCRICLCYFARRVALFDGEVWMTSSYLSCRCVGCGWWGGSPVVNHRVI